MLRNGENNHQPTYEFIFKKIGKNVISYPDLWTDKKHYKFVSAAAKIYSV